MNQSFDSLFGKALREAVGAGLAKVNGVSSNFEEAFQKGFTDKLKLDQTPLGIEVKVYDKTQEAAIGADISIAWGSLQARRIVYLQIKVAYNGYNHYCGVVKDVEPDKDRWKESKKYFDAVYGSKSKGDHAGKLQILQMQETVWGLGERAEAGFLIFESPQAVKTGKIAKEASVIPLPAFVHVLIGNLARVPEAKLGEQVMGTLNGSKLNDVLLYQKSIDSIIGWPAKELE